MYTWPHPEENTFTHSCFTHLEQLILKYNFKLFFLFMNKWFIAAGVDWANASYTVWSLKQKKFSSCCHSESGSSSKVLLLSSNDQMSGASWGCEGVFLWCYGCVCVFVMWQEVVTSGRRVLSDDGSWRSHVWDESGRGVGEEEIKSYVKKRKIGAFTQQTGLPSPSR